MQKKMEGSFLIFLLNPACFRFHARSFEIISILPVVLCVLRLLLHLFKPLGQSWLIT
jgi:hypothetical protein